MANNTFLLILLCLILSICLHYQLFQLGKREIQVPFQSENFTFYPLENNSSDRFSLIKCWSGIVPDGQVVVYPSTFYHEWIFHWNKQFKDKSARSFSGPFLSFDNLQEMKDKYKSPPMRPPTKETSEYWETLAILDSVVEANRSIVMMELGAGFGFWSLLTYSMNKQLGNLPITLVVVEADPIHFQFLKMSLSLNRVKESQVISLQGAVHTKDEMVHFMRSNPDQHYGAAIQGSNYPVIGYSLESLISPFWYVDLIDFDIQGSEEEVIKSGKEILIQRVKRIHVECHGKEIYWNLKHFIQEEMGWEIKYDLEFGKKPADDGHGHFCAVNPFI
jgi:FkbM family methyltransferase